MNLEHGFLDGQVLQRLGTRGASATVRGTCTEAGKAFASIAGKRGALNGWKARPVGQARAGRFTARLNGIPVGGPYEITLTVGSESVTAHRVRVGDVWLLAGQSNMQGCGNLATAPKPHPLVHAMYMDDHWGLAREPIHFLADSPDRVHWLAHGNTPPTRAQRDKLLRVAAKGVGPGIFFGREMVERSGGVPQGLLCTAHGGTSMEQWDPGKKHLGGDSLYGSMLRTWRKTGQPVAGVLWYQGESDCTQEAAPFYSERMRKFVAALRRDLRQPALPFLLVQIGKVFGTNWDAKSWNSVQHQQVELKNHIRHYDVVATIDLPLDDSIHVGTEGYARLGVRLARLADRMVYGNAKELPAPELISVEPKQTPETKKYCPYRLELKFRNVVGGLRAAGLPSGFSFVDGNHNNPNAIYKTVLDGDTIYLESVIAANLGDYRLMHGHGCAPYVHITDARDMALPVFGPVRLEAKPAMSPFIHKWLVSGIQPVNGSVAKLAPPRPLPRLKLEPYTTTESFVSQHQAWDGKSGLAFLFSEVTLPEPMNLNLRMGYDGPIKVWINDRPVFCDPNGSNPAVPDQGIVPVRLRAGKHRVSVAMDLNGGLAWGFFMRFNRTDLSKARIASGKFDLPVCSL
jgi:hypothetical protein